MINTLPFTILTYNPFGIIWFGRVLSGINYNSITLNGIIFVLCTSLCVNLLLLFSRKEKLFELLSG
jgi:hypothetical protein